MQEERGKRWRNSSSFWRGGWHNEQQHPLGYLSVNLNTVVSGISRRMSTFLTRSLVALLATSFLAVLPLCAQQPPEAFHWVNFHSDADSDVVSWVRHALEGQQWTVIREI